MLSVDPQLRVPEERLYVRVEDTVAITDEGCEVLTADAPYDMDEVEALLARYLKQQVSGNAKGYLVHAAVVEAEE